MGRYDDFLGTAIDTTKWTVESIGTATVSVSDGLVHFFAEAGSGDACHITSIETFRRDTFRARVRAVSGDYAESTLIRLAIYGVGINNVIMDFLGDNSVIAKMRKEGVWGDPITIATGLSQGTFYIFELKVRNTSFEARLFNDAGVQIGSTVTLDIDLGDSPKARVLGYASGNSTINCAGDCDYVDVAGYPYAPPEEVPPTLAERLVKIPVTTYAIVALVIAVLVAVVWYATRRR